MARVKYEKLYSTDTSLDDLMKIIPTIGTNIVFEEDTWFADKASKVKKVTKGKNSVYFNTIPQKYRHIVKIFALMRFRKRKATITVRGDVANMSTFTNFLQNELNSLEIQNVNKKTIGQYMRYINNIYENVNYKSSLWTSLSVFFKTIKGWEGLYKTNPMPRKCPYIKESVDAKYIPEFVTKQLDKVMKNEIIPIHMRTMYWILRTIPSRITEVTELPIECIKPYDKDNDRWVIFMPNFKQNGGYKKPRLRAIHFKNEGHGKYLFDLIKEQQKIANELQSKVPIEHKGMLFTHHVRCFDPLLYKKNGTIKYKTSQRVCTSDSAGTYKWIHTICNKFNVVDENGKIYVFTSHQLRHNAITDRLHEGFEPVKIRKMTDHANDKMIIETYNHLELEFYAEKRNLVEKRKDNQIENIALPPILFRGRILNLDTAIENMLLRNPRAHKLKYGICGDITGCKTKEYECLACDYFIPNADDLDYFLHEKEQWNRKVIMFKNSPKLLENAQYNLELFEKVIEKIRKLENYH